MLGDGWRYKRNDFIVYVEGTPVPKELGTAKTSTIDDVIVDGHGLLVPARTTAGIRNNRKLTTEGDGAPVPLCLGLLFPAKGVLGNLPNFWIAVVSP
jgi:hypothetical protein